MKILSLGLGIQSTAVYLMSSLGYLERVDHAVFADPDAELPDTYKLLEYILEWQKLNNGIPIHVVKKSLYDDLLAQQNSTGERVASIPAFTGNNTGMLRRQCTKEYKIDSVIKKIRELHGLKPRKRMPMTQVWLGISLDEIQRCKTSMLPRVEYYYPLVEERMTRGDCMRFLEERGFNNVPKSACVFCPYHSDRNWKDLQYNHPEEFKKAVKVDEAIRDSSARGLDEPIYLHRSCKPLKDIEFADQQEMFMCEEGFCGL
jgi:hypothetical protein